MLVDELYIAMLEDGDCARRNKFPGPFARTMTDIAQKTLDLWRRDERAAMRFASMVLAGPTDLRVSTGQLPAVSPPILLRFSFSCFNLSPAQTREDVSLVFFTNICLI